MNVLRCFTTFLLAIACVAMTVALVRDDRAIGQATPDQKIETTVPRVLDSPIADIQFDNAPLEEVVAKIAAMTGTNLCVEWRALEGVGIDRNAPVTLHLRNATLSQVLGRINATFQGNARIVQEVGDDGVMIITTPEEMWRDTVTQIYNVRDLILAIVTDGRRRATADRDPRELLNEQDAEDTLVKLITDTVETDSWRSSGGGDVGIRLIRGLLIVNHHREAQREIRRLLEQLRSAFRANDGLIVASGAYGHPRHLREFGAGH